MQKQQILISFINVLLSIVLFSSLCFSADDSGEYIHYRLGVKYKDEKRYDDAIEEFRKVLASYPDNYNAYMLMAEIRTLQGQPNLTVYNLKKALQYNPGWNKAHKMLADAYEKDGQLQSAMGELQLYMQSCDPAERDSLQKIINRLVPKSGPGAAGDLGVKVPVNSALKGRVDQNTNDNMNLKTAVALPGDPQADEKFISAVKLYDQKKYDEALETLKQVRSMKPAFSGVYYYAGMIRRFTGQQKMAKINLLRGVDYPEQGYNAYLQLGKIFGEEQNYLEAIKQLNQYILKAKSNSEKKDAMELIASYQKAAGIEVTGKPSIDTSGEKGTADEFQNKIIPQEKYLSSIEIQIDSLLSMVTVDTLTDAGQRLLAGIREFTKGNYDQAIREFKRTLASNPNGSVSLNCIYNTAICYYRLHLFKDAEYQFQQVIEKFPEHPIAKQSLFLKACTYLERGEYAIAENILRNFLQNNKNHVWAGLAFEKLGDAYIEMEQDKKSIDAYLQAIAKSPSNYSDQVRTYFKLGNVFVRIGNSPRAIESFNSAITIGEKQSIFMRVPDAYYRVADEKYKQKDYKGALEYYVKVTRKYPSFQETPWGLFQIGTIYKNLKQYQDAVNMFKELMKKYPDDYWSKQALWKLEDTIWENEYQAVLK
jgi:tetratricopeptide (TPR) repeat protein